MPSGSLDFGTNFTSFDWVIVAVYLLGTLAVGIYVNRYIRSMADYIVAGRALKLRLGIATMIGTELGLVTIMYAAQKGYTGGFAPVLPPLTGASPPPLQFPGHLPDFEAPLPVMR